MGYKGVIMNKPFIYGSVCSGIEAATVAWHPLGWRRRSSRRLTASPRPCWPIATRRFPTVATSRRSTSLLDQSTFSWEEPPANPSLSPDCEAEWMTRVASWHSSFFDLLAAYAPVGWCGKTSPVSCHPTEDGTLAPSSGGWQNSGIVAPGECWTLSTSEYPSDGVASSLSDILETGDHLRPYYLSAKACAGILRRAAKRGKELPQQLRRALWAMMAAMRTRAVK